MKYIFFLLLAQLFSACAKDDNCIDHIIGTYSGYAVASTNATLTGEIIISKDPASDSSLVIVDKIIASTGVIFTGTLSADCKTITIPFQTSQITSGISLTYAGTFHIEGASMNGSATVNFMIPADVNYTLTKK